MENRQLNILVTGASGQLGRCVKRESSRSDDRFFFTDVDTLDITDSEAVSDFLREHSIDVVINCAAFTDVEKAEENPDGAAKLNVDAVRNLAGAVAKTGGVLIHISTDYVFGGSGKNTPLDEDESPAPTGVYGLTKLSGEQVVKDSGVRFLIFRTAWLYSEFGKNFLKTMLALFKSHDHLKVVFDQVGTPTYAGDLAAAIVDIITSRIFSGREGIYHFSNEGVCSWYDFAKTIAAMTDGECDIHPCHSDEFPSKVVRPSYSVLDKTKFKSTFGLPVPYWTDSLKVCLNNLNNEA